MKKIFAIPLAILLAFGLLGCPTDDGGGENLPTTVTISFDLNVANMPDGADGTTFTKPVDVTISRGGKLTSAQLAKPAGTDATVTFKGWFTAPTGGTEVVPAVTALNGNTILYAQWEAFDSDTQARVTFLLNYGSDLTTVHAERTVTITQAIGVGAFPAAPSRGTGWEFEEWNTAANGSGTAFDSNTTVAVSISVYAQWTEVAGPVEPGKPVTITFNLNIPDTYDGPLYTLPDETQTSEAGTLSSDQLQAPEGDGGAGDSGISLFFNGWYRATSGGAKITVTDVFAANTEVYAQWLEVNEENEIVITFNLMDGSNAASSSTFTRKFTKDVAPGTQGDGENQWPNDPAARDGYTFEGWVEVSNGMGLKLDKDSTFPAPAAGKNITTVYANFVSTSGPVEETPPEGTDLAGAEKVTLTNSQYVVYKFDLPVGTTWGDFKNLTVDYMVSQSNYEKENFPRNMRLMGNYKDVDFTLGTRGTDSAPLAIADYNKAKNNQFIMGNAVPSISYSGATVKSMLETLGKSAQPWEWFTIEYPLDGTGKDTLCVNLPTTSDTGIFYLGIGIGTQPVATQYIRNATLVHNSNNAADNVVAIPLWFKQDDKLYPALTSYGSFETGGDGVKEFSREMVDGSQPTPVDLASAPKTPVLDHYTVTGSFSQFADETITAITVTGKASASPGVVSPVKYDGNTALPSAVGRYPVTFDVAAAEGWNAATISVGTLVIKATKLTDDDTSANLTPVVHSSSADNANGTLAVNGNVVTVDNKVTRTNLGFYYNLPANWAEYDTITFTFNSTIRAGVAKLTAKKGTTDFNNGDLVGNNGQYVDLVAGSKSVTFATTEFWNMTEDGISFQVNSWGDIGAALIMDFDVECTKIELKNAN